MAKISILIVDDAEWVRRDLRTLLDLTDDLRVVGEAADGLEAVQLAETLNPDVVLTDLEMPNLDGYETARRIKDRHPARAVVVLTMYGHEDARQRARQAGADGFVEKGNGIKVLIETIRSVSRTT